MAGGTFFLFGGEEVDVVAGRYSNLFITLAGAGAGGGRACGSLWRGLGLLAQKMGGNRAERGLPSPNAERLRTKNQCS